MLMRAGRRLLAPSLAEAAQRALWSQGGSAGAECGVLSKGLLTISRALPSGPAAPAATATARSSIFLTRRFSATAEPAPPAEQVQDERYDPSRDGGFVAPHPSSSATPANLVNARDAASYLLMHPVYTDEYVRSVEPTHKPPVKLHEKLGFWAVQAARGTFDFLTAYGKDMTEKKWLTRILYLETVAGVPGMVAAMLRHLRSLRTMSRDHGWIHTLLEEAENERMHLLTFMQLREPGPLFRAAVLLGQGVFMNVYFLSYIISPRTCHAFVGYLEEEAVRTYTKLIQELEAGKLPEWQHAEVPEIARSYWKLKKDASMADLFLAVRADEAAHKHVNHVFSEMRATDSNPFAVGSVHAP